MSRTSFRRAADRFLFCWVAGVVVLFGASRSAFGRDGGSPENTSGPWTLMIYAAVDNRAEGAFIAEASRLVTGRGVEIVLFVDRSDSHSNEAGGFGEDFSDSRLYRLGSENWERVSGGAQFPEVTLESEYEADTARTRNLRKFISFAKTRYPARRYGLILYGEADGRVLLADEGSRSVMGAMEISNSLSFSESVDLAVLDLCSMASIELAYDWRPGVFPPGFSAGTLVAIPSLGEGLPWHLILPRWLASDRAPVEFDAEELGTLILEETRRFRRHRLRFRGNPERKRAGALESGVCLDLSMAERVKRSVDGLASVLYREDARDVMEGIRGPRNGPRAMHYGGPSPDAWEAFPHFDLYDLARRLAEQVHASVGLRTKAREVCESVDALVVGSFGLDGYRDFLPGRNGVYVVYPFSRETEEGSPTTMESSELWSSYAWYGPRRGVPGATFGNYSWCRDGARPGNGLVENWFELLDAWYDGDALDGGANHYLW